MKSNFDSEPNADDFQTTAFVPSADLQNCRSNRLVPCDVTIPAEGWAAIVRYRINCSLCEYRDPDDYLASAIRLTKFARAVHLELTPQEQAAADDLVLRGNPITQHFMLPIQEKKTLDRWALSGYYGDLSQCAVGAICLLEGVAYHLGLGIAHETTHGADYAAFANHYEDYMNSVERPSQKTPSTASGATTGAASYRQCQPAGTISPATLIRVNLRRHQKNGPAFSRQNRQHQRGD